MQQEINVQEMGSLLKGYQGKRVSVGIDPIWAENTYQKFSFDMYGPDDNIIFYDMQRDVPQELHIIKENIEKILYMASDSRFDSVFSIFLKDGRIDFCLDEKKIRCCKCRELINIDPMATIWSVSGCGNYGSKFEGEKLNLSLCDNCLGKILGYEDGETSE